MASRKTTHGDCPHAVRELIDEWRDRFGVCHSSETVRCSHAGCYPGKRFFATDRIDATCRTHLNDLAWQRQVAEQAEAGDSS